jgi:hypothetical protein
MRCQHFKEEKKRERKNPVKMQTLSRAREHIQHKFFSKSHTFNGRRKEPLSLSLSSFHLFLRAKTEREKDIEAAYLFPSFSKTER